MPPKKRKAPGAVGPESQAAGDGARSDGSKSNAVLEKALHGDKRKKMEEPAGSKGTGVLAEAVRQARLKVAPSIAEFKYNKKRVRLISSDCDLKEGARGILYWMSRDQRVQGEMPREGLGVQPALVHDELKESVDPMCVWQP